MAVSLALSWLLLSISHVAAEARGLSHGVAESVLPFAAGPTCNFDTATDRRECRGSMQADLAEEGGDFEGEEASSLLQLPRLVAGSEGGEEPLPDERRTLSEEDPGLLQLPGRIVPVSPLGRGGEERRTLSEEDAQQQQLEEEGAESAVTVALSLELFGFMLAIMMLFYFTNSPDERFRGQTWNVLSSTVSIFSAVLLFKVGKDITGVLFNEPLQPEAEAYDLPPPATSNTMAQFYRVLFCLATVNILLVLTHHEGQTMRAIAGVGAHVVGFASIEAFSAIQQYPPFRSSPLLCLVAAFVSGAAIFFIHSIAGWLRFFAKPVLLTNWKEWDKTCIEAQREAACLTLGLLIAQAIKYQIIGHLAPLHGHPKEKSIAQICSLLGAAFAMGAVAFTQVFARRKFKASLQTKRIQQWLAITLGTTTMVMAWCALDGVRWAFWHLAAGKAADAMSAKMLVVLACMITGFSVIVVLNKIAGPDVMDERFTAPFVNAVGLAMGLAWEGCFSQAAVSVGVATGGEGRLVTSGLFLCICLVVLPAWALYIQPRAPRSNEEEEEEDEGKDFTHIERVAFVS